MKQRTVLFEGKSIAYLLEYKAVRNLNLRVRKDGSVYVSANPSIPEETVDDFVKSKGDYILSALAKFEELAQYMPQPKQFVSGETFQILGRGLRLKVSKGEKNDLISDGLYIYLQVKDPLDFARKKSMVTKYLDEQCKTVFHEVLQAIYPPFQKYDVPMPALRIREMDTRWGSCLAKKGIITLNKRLLEAPRNCIEYVVMHELCHFIHPDHSKQFYGFMTMLMPDWKERKTLLDQSAIYWL